ncbi:MAG TPA: ABC transporter substrate-binding protein [Nocardioidaceae bacterium]|nr:ABC transporter substrate-binding protein [Nocardioidaceae bacterium]
MRAKTPLRCAAVAATFALLAACGGGGGGGNEGSGGGGGGGGGGDAQAQGGTLTAQLTEPSALAPAQDCYESECSSVLNLLNDPLVSVDLDSGELVYDGLLESVETQDNRVFTVNIKPNRTFHNGEPVNADAFIRAWNYSADPKNEMDTTGFLSKIEGYGQGQELSGLRKVDDMTFEVTLAEPFQLFPTTMSYSNAFAPIAQECFDNLKKCNESPIGTGAYQMNGVWQHSQAINVSRWNGYQGEQTANPDNINFQMTTDLVSAWRAFQGGQIDITELDPTIYQEAKASEGDRVMLSETGNWSYLGYPTETAPYDDPQMRQALSMAFDRQLIIDQVLNGIYAPAEGIVPPAIPGSQENACEYCQYDPERAKQLFQQAGGQPGMTVNLWFNAGSGHDPWVEAIGNQLKQNLGVEFQLQAREWAQYLEVLDAGDFTGPFRLGWLPDYPAAENYLRPIVATGGDSNYTGYSSNEVDNLIAQGDQAETTEEAQQFYQQAENAALQDMPLMPLWVSQAPTVYAENLENVSYNLMDEVPHNEIIVN